MDDVFDQDYKYSFKRVLLSLKWACAAHIIGTLKEDGRRFVRDRLFLIGSARRRKKIIN